MRMGYGGCESEGFGLIFDFTEIEKTKMDLLKCREMIDGLLKSDIFNSQHCLDDQKEKIAIYSTTSNTFDMLRASLKSLYFNSDVDRVILVTDTKDIPHDFPKDLEIITLNEQPEFLIEDGPNSGCRFTYFCLLRVGFHKMFPDMKHIDDLNKYLTVDGMDKKFDFDTVIRKDISEIWDNNLGDRYYVAGVLEPRRTKGTVYGYNPFDSFIAQSTVQFKNVSYINGGVMLLNLKKLRDDGVGDDMIDLINEHEFFCPEQDVINAMCHRNIKVLPPTYNSMDFSFPVVDPKIVHYATKANKLEMNDAKIYSDLPWTRIKERREKRYKKKLTLGDEVLANEVKASSITLEDLAKKKE